MADHFLAGCSDFLQSYLQSEVASYAGSGSRKILHLAKK